MNSTSDKSTVFAQQQRVAEFQESCQPRQRALLSLLAVCEKHSMDPAPIIDSFAQDLPRTPLESRRRTRKFFWSRIEDLSTQISDTGHPEAALIGCPGLLPDTVELGLHLENFRGTTGEFNRMWLDRVHSSNDSPQSESQIARILPTFLKVGAVIWFTMFIMIWVVPEFKKMAEEFALELPVALQISIELSDWIIKNWFIFFFLSLISLPWLLPAFKKYFKRWHPFIWRQPTIPKSVKTKQALSLVIQYRNLISATALWQFSKLRKALGLGIPAYFGAGQDQPVEAMTEVQLDWQELSKKKVISPAEAEALSITESAETQAWLLYKSSAVQQFNIESRGMLISRFAIMTINIVLLAWVILMVFSILSMLITLITKI